MNGDARAPIPGARRRISTLRGVTHFLVLVASAVILLPIMAPLGLAPFRWRYRPVTLWSSFNAWWLRRFAGLDAWIEGAECIPRQPCIVVSKHQSSWETIVFESLFRPHCWVLKREFLRVPFAGWGAALLQPIPINRAAGHSAIRQLVRLGTSRLRQGRWVIVFPEGTRTSPGQRRRYHVGAGALSAATGVPVLPIAHNAGLFWPPHSPVRYRGTVHLRIGPPIDPAGLKPKEIVAAAEAWIEAQMPELIAEQRETIE